MTLFLERDVLPLIQSWWVVVTYCNEREWVVGSSFSRKRPRFEPNAGLLTRGFLWFDGGVWVRNYGSRELARLSGTSPRELFQEQWGAWFSSHYEAVDEIPWEIHALKSWEARRIAIRAYVESSR